MARREPSARLRAHVESYCGYVERGTSPLRRRELPSGEVVLILSFGPPIRVDGRPRTSFVAGLHGAHAITEHDGIQEGLQVNLTPLGAFRLFGPPPTGVPGRVVDLADVLGRHADLLVEQAYEAGSWTARFDLVDALLAARFAQQLPASPDVAWAWHRLTETGGTVPIGELVRDLRCSRRHLT